MKLYTKDMLFNKRGSDLSELFMKLTQKVLEENPEINLCELKYLIDQSAGAMIARESMTRRVRKDKEAKNED